MSSKIKNVSLVKDIFEWDKKPENFGFLILPTLREYELFCLTLDRMMSDNLDDNFFDGQIGQVDLRNDEILSKIGSIRKLEIWINKFFRPANQDPMNEMFTIFREIRGLRSKPAHAIFNNEWNIKFFEDQKRLMKKAYQAIRTLRLILANHPAAKSIEIPDWLFKGEIRTF